MQPNQTFFFSLYSLVYEGKSFQRHCGVGILCMQRGDLAFSRPTLGYSADTDVQKQRYVRGGVASLQLAWKCSMFYSVAKKPMLFLPSSLQFLGF